MKPVILGVYEGHDASAALLIDGKLAVQVHKERLSRVKGDRGSAQGCIDYCLAAAGLKITDVDYIATSNGTLTTSKAVTTLSGGEYSAAQPHAAAEYEVAGTLLPGSSIRHHHAHIASAYFLSPYDEALVISMDGGGDFCATLSACCRGNAIEKYWVNDTNLGIIWNAASTTLGFPWLYGPGRVMGLAGYGEPRFRDGLFAYLGGDYGRLTLPDFDAVWHDYMQTIFSGTGNLGAITCPDSGGKWHGLPPFAGLDKRDPQAADNRDVAASLQRLTDETVSWLVEFARKRFPAVKNICLTGGVALNVMTNRAVRDALQLENMFIPPAPHDGGLAVGLALYAYHVILGERERIAWSPYCGREYSTEDICAAAAGYGDAVTVTAYDSAAELVARIAGCLREDKTIGWYLGGGEWGPRALGHRSILASPKRAEMKQWINDRIKHREAFRPYAPLVKAEAAGEYFDVSFASPYMLFAAGVREKHKSALPAIVHVDGTARVQTVDRAALPELWQLLDRLEQDGLPPVLLNTSLNGPGEPIVETPAEALELFTRSGMDLLVMSDRVVEKTAVSG